jgi:protein-tyrosine phosphatase
MEKVPLNNLAMISRDVCLDLDRIVSFGIKTIICCLDDKELAYLGAPWTQYGQEAERRNIHVIRLPIVEGKAPSSIEDVETVLKELDTKMGPGSHVLCHCRGGIGRAGVMASCYLIRQGICANAHDAIAMVRKRRSPKAIETIEQEQFIHKYDHWWKSRNTK